MIAGSTSDLDATPMQISRSIGLTAWSSNFAGVERNQLVTIKEGQGNFKIPIARYKEPQCKDAEDRKKKGAMA